MLKKTVILDRNFISERIARIKMYIYFYQVDDTAFERIRAQNIKIKTVKMSFY